MMSGAPKKTALIVEDDRILVNILKDFFEKSGVEIHVASDGEAANELVRSMKPDFVILDIRLPKRDGIEVLKIIREKDGLKDLPVLIFTNFDKEEYKNDAENLGALDFLIKVNCDPKNVVLRVVKFLETGEWQRD